MEIITFVERATVVYHPDGTIKGSEAHQHTGYHEVRETDEGPLTVFVVVKHEVRPVLAGDFNALLPAGEAFLANAGQELKDKRECRRQHLAEATQRIAALEATVAEQVSSIAAQAEALATASAALAAEKAARIADAEKARRASQGEDA
ncbi:hypothetical protein [Sphingomonas sp. TX0522]|uniref:hypothetical protein n=1 Tax=Sphingomonas sp. TX0522 TaxID=2479205 RepID=UPI0018E05B64|nr:hypothetical protein [Sphingomonas sp. TX0522]MBI0530076.1 hypothetical protein [Sphingomonas sp. TX0522]